MKQIEQILAAAILFGPIVSLVALSLIGFTSLKSSERVIKRTVAFGQSIGFFGGMVIAFHMVREFILTGAAQPMGVLHYHLFSFGFHSVEIGLQLDFLNIWFVVMAIILSNIVGVFSQHYLHRDPGFYRFFFLIVLFLNGILIVFMGNTFQTLFMGWELVGITSALLISFFTIRRETIDNALHAFWAYRVSDIGLLCGSALLAAHLPEQVFSLGGLGRQQLPHELFYIVPFLFLLSAMGKSAQFPYSSWLPRAMEGPTSSSAIFYGGLSIHAGVYLLLRLRLQYEVPTAMLIATALVGAVSCVYGVLLSQVQSDVKSALAYASLSQVGIMFIEISLGWYYIATIHCIGHAFLRTYQILKCSSIIDQFVAFEDAHQFDSARAKAGILQILVPQRFISQLFSFSFDLALRAASGRSLLVASLDRLSHKLQTAEDKWLHFVAGLSRKQDSQGE
jgi:NADH:ubiquinone oxidoreductase subunit 5 (subunit L)/multisubunit Na+/H+ antiporter MnhA subunit